MNFPEMYSATGMMELIQKIGCFAEREQARRSPRQNCAGNTMYVRKVL